MVTETADAAEPDADATPISTVASITDAFAALGLDTTADPAPDPGWDRLWRYGSAPCGCALWAHLDVGDPGVLALLHDNQCADGIDPETATVHAKMASHLGIPVPDGADAVTITRDALGEALAADDAARQARHRADIDAILAVLAERMTPVELAGVRAAVDAMTGDDFAIDNHLRAALGSVRDRHDDRCRETFDRLMAGEASVADFTAATDAAAAEIDELLGVEAVAPAVAEPVAPVAPPEPTSAGTIPASIMAYMQHDAVWEMTPALRRIAADADRNGISRWAQLGAALTRVSAAIPPRVQLVGATGEPGSTGTANLDVFVVISGPGGSGKSLAIKAGRAYVPEHVHGFAVHPTATGEGLNKGLREQQFGAGGGEDPTPRRWCASTLMEEAEGENFERMALQPGSTLLPQLRMHWGADLAGKQTAGADYRTTVDALWARVAALLVLHPELCAYLLNQVGNGSAARFVWLPAYRTGSPTGTGIERPFRLPDYRTGTDAPPVIGELMQNDDLPPSVFWIRRPPAMEAAMAAEPVRTYVDPVAVTELDDTAARRMHDMLQRFKLATVLAAMDEVAQPGDVHWHAACEIVAVSHLVQTGLQSAVARIREIEAETRGADLAVTDVTRNATRDELVRGDEGDAEVAIITALAAAPMTREELRNAVRNRSRSCRRGYTKALGRLQAAGTVAGGYGEPLRLVAPPTTTTGTMTVPPASPA